MSRRRIMDDPIIISTQTNAPVMRVLWDKGVADREHNFSHGEAVKRFTGGSLGNHANVPWADWFKENIEIEHFDEFQYFTGIKDLTDGLSGHLFYHCTNLKSIKLPENLQRIGTWYSYYNGPFTGTQIEYIKIPDSVYNIGASLLSDMPKLKKVTWSKNLPVGLPMGAYAIDTFSDCPNLTEIENFPTEYTPGNISSMFDNCNRLDVYGKFPMAYQMDQCGWRAIPYKKAEYTFSNVITTTQQSYRFTLPSVEISKEVGAEAGFFVNLPNIETFYCHYWSGPSLVTIGQNCRVMENSPYSLNCQAGMKLRFLSETPPVTNGQNMSSVQNLTRIYVPENAVDAYKIATGWSTAASKVRPWKDTTNVQFVSFSSNDTISSDYTKIDYVTNFNGTSPVDTNLGIDYIPKTTTHILVDFEHSEGLTSGYDFELLSNSYTFSLSSNDVWPWIQWNGNNERWYFNSKITGEPYTNRSLLKIGYDFIQYHNYTWQKDVTSSDGTRSFSIMSSSGRRNCKIYRLAIFEPIENCTDFNDPSQYICVRDYIPCKRNSDNAIGLYERINDVFYTKNTIYGPTE